MSVENELIALEEAMWKANREGGGDFYASMLRDDALAVSPWGVADKGRAVAGIAANHNPYHSTDLSEISVLRVNEDAAVVTYKVVIVSEANGPDNPLVARASSVYAREDGTWRAVFFQFTAV